LDKNKLS